MVLVNIDRGQPALGGLTMLEASAQEFLEFAQAQKEGRLPFHQGVDNPTANGAIRPAVASDVDNDGLDELILLDSGVNQGVEDAVYLIFDWTGPGLRWRRIGADGDSASIPSKAVLDYLAAVQAAGGTAEAWDGHAARPGLGVAERQTAVSPSRPNCWPNWPPRAAPTARLPPAASCRPPAPCWRTAYGAAFRRLAETTALD